MQNDQVFNLYLDQIVVCTTKTFASNEYLIFGCIYIEKLYSNGFVEK